ncbi:MAG: AraC family transcriptional regulator [Cytophagales bacterium]|nr:AraC family transcriptional regulator [Cytophagales bacterium]
MKPLYEKIDKSFGSSFTVRTYYSEHICCMPFWHIHPEYELVYIKNGHGKRHVGKMISTYTDGDLVLLGPNVPHSSLSNNIYKSNMEVVIQFNEDFAGTGLWNIPEMDQVHKLLQRSRQGISFGSSIRCQLADKLVGLYQLHGFERFIAFLKLLQELSKTKDYILLGADQSSLLIKEVDYDRINKVYTYVEEHFAKEISPGEIAQHINMTLPAFCRFFKRTTEKKFTEFLNEFRISYACQLIMEGSYSFSEISYKCGFQNVSYFNRQFKKIVGTNPTSYKSGFEKILAR